MAHHALYRVVIPVKICFPLSFHCYMIRQAKERKCLIIIIFALSAIDSIDITFINPSGNLADSLSLVMTGRIRDLTGSSIRGMYILGAYLVFDRFLS